MATVCWPCPTPPVIRKSEIVVTDAKSMCDAVNAAARIREPRIGIGIGEIQQSMATLSMQCRWLPHNRSNRMLADSMTTRLRKAHMKRLLDFIKSGWWQLHSERSELEQRQEEKERAGRALCFKLQSGELSGSTIDALQTSAQWHELSGCFLVRVAKYSTCGT
eukprot:5943414-Amphidinium_carterae.1